MKFHLQVCILTKTLTMMKQPNWLLSVLKLFVTWFLVTSLSFFIFLATNPDLAVSSLHANRVSVTAAAIVAEKERLGLDKPILDQYVTWLQDLFQGNLGESYVQRESVSTLILQALPNTLILALASLLVLSLLIYLYAKLLMAYQNHPLERLIRLLLLLISSLPSFWLGLILLTIFGSSLGLFSGLTTFFNPLTLILPVITLTSIYLGSYIRLVRNEILANQGKDYVAYYRYAGFDKSFIDRMVLKNSLSSTFVSLSISIPKMIAGSVIVETLFNWQGMGYLCVTAIRDRDFPLIQGYICVMTLLFLILNGICQAYNRWYYKKEHY